MALSCYVFARADSERHSLVVHCRFLGFWNSLACGLFCIPEKKKKRSHHAPPVSLRKIVRLWICPYCPTPSKASSTCMYLQLVWNLSRQFLCVWAREGEFAFFNAVACLWWHMEWPLPLTVSLQSLLLHFKYFLSLSFSQGLVALK